MTDSYIQRNRGENITSEMRAKETEEAMKIIGLPFIRAKIRDDIIDEWAVKELLGRFSGFERVYAPAVQGGNKDHDLIGRIAKELFPDVIQYTTYTPTELWTTGNTEIIPEVQEIVLKENALQCYQSQINLPATAPHFLAVKGGKSEWYI